CAMGGCRYSRPADRSDDFDNISAQLGWIHDLDDRQQVYASLSKAFRAPEVNELYRLQGGQVVADLESEELEGVEVGYRAGRDNVSYTVSAYYYDKENGIFQDSDRNNVSGAATRHKGMELGLAWALTDALTWNVAAGYARHHYVSDIPGVSIAGNEI